MNRRAISQMGEAAAQVMRAALGGSYERCHAVLFDTTEECGRRYGHDGLHESVTGATVWSDDDAAWLRRMMSL